MLQYENLEYGNRQNITNICINNSTAQNLPQRGAHAPETMPFRTVVIRLKES